jgi:hypothetical protein
MKRTFTCLMLLAVATGMLWTPALAKNDKAQKGKASPTRFTAGVDYVQGEVVVKFRNRASDLGKGKALGRVGGSSGRKLKRSRLEQIFLPPGADEERAIQTLLEDPAVESARLNWKVELLAFQVISTSMPTMVPDDLVTQQWHLDTSPFPAWFATSTNPVNVDVDIDAPEGWAVMEAIYGSALPAAVGVIDSGCGESGYYSPSTGYIPNHLDLPNSALFANTFEIPADSADSPADANSLVDDSNGWDFGRNGSFDDNIPEDNSIIFHGTKISGILAAQWDNGEGIAGIGRDHIKVLPLAALNSLDISAAVEYAMDLVEDGYPVRVLNMSFKTIVGGIGQDWPELRQLVNDAGKAPYHIAVVAAAGNDSSNNDDFLTRAFPAEYTRDPDISSVLAVASTDNNGSLSNFSNYGPESVQLAAPGRDIYTTGSDADPYLNAIGTSFATPIAGAVLGLVMAAHPGLTPAEAIDRVLMGGDFDARLSGLVTSGKRVNLAGALAPFYPYSGLAYLGSDVTVAMYSDDISSSYGTIVSADLEPAWSTSPVAATMNTAGATTLVVTPLAPGISQFTLAFAGSSSPVGTYETGPWRVTAIRPFAASIDIAETVTFAAPLLSGVVSWSVINSTVASIVTNFDDSATLTGLTPGKTRVALSIDGEVVDYSGQILVVQGVQPSPSSGGGGGCGTTLPPGDDPWNGFVELVLAGMLLATLRKIYQAEVSPMPKAQSPK